MIARRKLLYLLVLPLTACGQGPIETTQQADKTAACMSFRWAAPEEIRRLCGVNELYGLPNQACLLNDYLYVGPKPDGFNDERVLLSMGHELLHALGGKHK